MYLRMMLLVGFVTSQSALADTASEKARTLPSSAQVFAQQAEETQATPTTVVNTSRAQLRPRQHTLIASSMEGVLKEFPVQLGGRVKKGDRLASFNCRIFETQQAIAKSKLKAAEVAHTVNKRLLKMNGISELDYELGEAEADIRAAELARSGADVEKCRIHAPFDGIVAEKLAQAHQFMRGGEPMLRLVNTTDLEIETVVPSAWMTWLQVGQPMILHVEEINTPVAARVDRLVGEVDPVSQTIKLVGRLDGTVPENMLPGMSGTLQFEK